MKVCHITSVHKVDDARIFLKECRSLSHQYDVHLVAPNAPDELKDHVHVHGIQPHKGNKLSRMIFTVRKVYQKSLEINADLYHFHDPELIFVGLLLKKKGKKVIYDVHEDVPEQILSKDWIPRIFKKSIGRTVKKIEAWASKRFNGIVAATPELYKRFKQYTDHTVTVQNFSLLEEWDDEKMDEDSPAPQETNAVYIGAITKPRGIWEMVRALESLNQHAEFDVRLLLGGTFSPAKLEDQVKELEGWEWVDFKGWLDRAGVKKILQQASLGLVLIHPEPRYQVAYPVKLFEYMSAGLPVIASDFPLWRSIVEDAECGICADPLNPDEIANAISQLLRDPAKAKQMGENGRRAVEEKYNWKPEAEKLLDFYKRILGAVESV